MRIAYLLPYPEARHHLGSYQKSVKQHQALWPRCSHRHSCQTVEMLPDTRRFPPWKVDLTNKKYKSSLFVYRVYVITIISFRKRTIKWWCDPLIHSLTRSVTLWLVWQRSWYYTKQSHANFLVSKRKMGITHRQSPCTAHSSSSSVLVPARNKQPFLIRARWHNAYDFFDQENDNSVVAMHTRPTKYAMLTI